MKKFKDHIKEASKSTEDNKPTRQELDKIASQLVRKVNSMGVRNNTPLGIAHEAIVGELHDVLVDLLPQQYDGSILISGISIDIKIKDIKLEFDN